MCFGLYELLRYRLVWFWFPLVGLGAGGGGGGYEVWFGRFAPVGVLLCFVGYGISMLIVDCWVLVGVGWVLI